MSEFLERTRSEIDAEAAAEEAANAEMKARIDAVSWSAVWAADIRLYKGFRNSGSRAMESARTDIGAHLRTFEDRPGDALAVVAGDEVWPPLHRVVAARWLTLALEAQEADGTAGAAAGGAIGLGPPCVMGEQGPEAILPLRRGKEGRLLVKSVMQEIEAKRAAEARRPAWRGYARAALSGLLANNLASCSNAGDFGKRLHDFPERAAVLASAMQAAEDERFGA